LTANGPSSPAEVLAFVRETQPETWDALEKLHGESIDNVLLDDLTKALARFTEKGYKEIKTLVAFSGTVEDPDAPGVTYPEPDMNRDSQGRPIREKELPERFASEEYRVLLVAEKYQTGFDQPLLHSMYLDIPLCAANEPRATRTDRRLVAKPGNRGTNASRLDHYPRRHQ
jgi:hypothetical protein